MNQSHSTMFQPRHPPPRFQQFDYGHQRHVPFPEQAGPPQPQTQTFDYDHGRAGPDIRAGLHVPEVRDPTVPVALYHDLPAGLMVPLIQVASL